MKKMLKILSVGILFFGLSSAFVGAPINNTCILDEKYQPRWGDVLENERADFVKAIWEDGIIQDFHVVIENCEVVEFYSSSKRFKMNYSEYQRRNNKVMENINKW